MGHDKEFQTFDNITSIHFHSCFNLLLKLWNFNEKIYVWSNADIYMG